MEAIVILLLALNLIMSALLIGTFSKLSYSLEDINEALAKLYNELVFKSNKRKK